ncbi:MAG: DUF1588 domain-containing protein [Planctomycetota bacterium]
MKDVRAFLEAHCVRCHGEKKPKANVSLHKLNALQNGAADLEVWKKVFEQIDHNQMPPLDSAQPSAADRQRALAALKIALRSSGVKMDELKALDPGRGNWVDHEALFSGKAVGESGTPSRVWRLSPESYKQIFTRLDKQFQLNLPTNDQAIKAPWNLTQKWYFTDYSSSHRVSGAEYEHHLRNCTPFAKKIVAKLPNSSLKKLAAVSVKGKLATPEQVDEAVAETFEQLLHLPLQPATLKHHSGFLLNDLKSGDTALALEQFLIGVLCHPEVLYRIERPDGAAKRGILPPRHLARAIAFTLTDREPDAELWKAADEGNLATNEDVRKQVERILNDPAIPKPRLAEFFREYFGYPMALSVPKCVETVNELQSEIGCGFQMGFAGEFVRDTDRLIEWVLESDKDVLRTLLTTRKSFMRGNSVMDYQKRKAAILERMKLSAERAAKEGKPFDDKTFQQDLNKLLDGARGQFHGGNYGILLAIYGITSPDPKRWDDFVSNLRRPVLIAKPRVPVLDFDNWLAGKPYEAHPEERMGILTQSSWLFAHGTATDNHAIHRGRWIRERLLGGRILEVPITVNAALPDEPHHGLRERMRVTRDDYCWNCHKQMDPLGLPFEQFDHLGRYRTAEIVVDKEKNDAQQAKSPGSRRNMKAVPFDATGAITDSGDPKLDGEVKGPFDLIEKLANSQKVEQVFVRHVFRYFLGRNETLADGPDLVAAHKAYRDSGGSMKALLVSLLSSDASLIRTSEIEVKKSQTK